MSTANSGAGRGSQACPPASCSAPWLNAAAVGLVLTAAYAVAFASSDFLERCALVLALTVVAFTLLEIVVRKAHRSPDSGLTWNRAFRPLIQRVAIKLVGLYAMLAVLALAYVVLPEYAKNQYRIFFDLCRNYGWIFVALSIPYFFFVDGHMRRPLDEYWKLGMLCLGRLPLRRLRTLRSFLLGWLVKGFFLPLMVRFLHDHLAALENFSRLSSVDAAFHLLFGADVLIATAGYLMTWRLLNAHIRSAEPTLLGWLSAVVCYPPLNLVVMSAWFGHRQFLAATSWIAPWPWLEFSLDVLSLFAITVYTLGTVAFGCRFSNLTHRGIVTNGVYRYCKHPAYLSKNLFWWLEVLRNLPSNWFNAVQAIVLMACVSAIYWLRAVTEERHLSRDPAYREYSRWISENGLWAKLIGLARRRSDCADGLRRNADL